MAQFSIHFYSNVLHRNTTFQMVIPNDKRSDGFPPAPEQVQLQKKMKTLFLLHGYTGDAGNWVPEWLCEQYNFAIVIPSGENSFWLDAEATGHQFATFVGRELVDYVRRTFGLAMSREDTYLMGFSMGGFGALHTAFQFPEIFGKTAALSSALIHHEVAEMKPGGGKDGKGGNDVANYAYYRECFGEPSKVLESDANPETLVKKIKAGTLKTSDGSKAVMPEIFMACGTEDFLLEPNRAFHAFLEEEGVKHVYMESKGIHDMNFWQEYAAKFVPMMFGE